MPQNISELDQFTVEEWRNIPDTVVINLVGSMRRRYKLIVENHGERISY